MFDQPYIQDGCQMFQDDTTLSDGFVNDMTACKRSERDPPPISIHPKKRNIAWRCADFYLSFPENDLSGQNSNTNAFKHRASGMDYLDEDEKKS
jgi:hypothetical protein